MDVKHVLHPFPLAYTSLMGVGLLERKLWVFLLVLVSMVTIVSLPPALLLMAGLAQVEFGTSGLMVSLKETSGLSALLSASVLGKLLLVSAWMLGRVQGVSVRRIGVARGLLPGALTGLILWVVIGLVPGLRLSGPEHSFIQGMSSSATLLDLVYYALAMIVVMPVAEEVYFRGSLQPALRYSIGYKASVIMGSFAFAALHTQGQMIVAYAAIGILLTLLAKKYGLVSSICAHSVFNALCFLAVVIK